MQATATRVLTMCAEQCESEEFPVLLASDGPGVPIRHCPQTRCPLRRFTPLLLSVVTILRDGVLATGWHRPSRIVSAEDYWLYCCAVVSGRSCGPFQALKLRPGIVTGCIDRGRANRRASCQPCENGGSSVHGAVVCRLSLVVTRREIVVSHGRLGSGGYPHG